MKLFLGGDSGYDTHFKAIGDLYGPFDLAILECGQYDKSWKYIHTLPAEVVQAAKDLGAVHMMPVHWGKFALSNHAWDDPIRKVSAISQLQDQPLVTPMIGEAVNLRSMEGSTSWWTNVQ